MPAFIGLYIEFTHSSGNRNGDGNCDDNKSNIDEL